MSKESLASEPGEYTEPPLVGDTTITVLDVQVDLADNVATAETVLEMVLRYRYAKISEQELLDAMHALVDSGASIQVVKPDDVVRLDKRLDDLSRLATKAEELAALDAELAAHEIAMYGLETKKQDVLQQTKPYMAVERLLHAHNTIAVGQIRTELLALIDEATELLKGLRATYWAKEDALQEWETHHTDLKGASDAVIQGRSWEMFSEVKTLRDGVALAKTNFGTLATATHEVLGVTKKTDTTLVSPALKQRILEVTALVATYETIAGTVAATELNDEISQAFTVAQELSQKRDALYNDIKNNEDNFKRNIAKVVATIANRAEKYIASVHSPRH